MMKFFREVREQILRVTPPTWREVVVTAIFVAILALLMSFIFFGIDYVLIQARNALIVFADFVIGLVTGGSEADLATDTLEG